MPKVFKPRSAPHAVKDAIENKLHRIADMGVLGKVGFSNCAAPIFPVVIPDGVSVRLCGDYKVTVNSVLEVDQNPLPDP